MGDVDDFVTRLKMFDAPLDADYFSDAMDYFREEYDPVAFLYVSNDMKWTRENIPNEKGEQLNGGLKSINESMHEVNALSMPPLLPLRRRVLRGQWR